MIQTNYTQEQLDSLLDRLLCMGAKTRQALRDATHAVLHGDMSRASSVLDNDADIDQLENDIDEMSLHILARHQPVARDLRSIMSAIRLVQEFERIGDESVTMAEQSIMMDKEASALIRSDLELLTERVITQFDVAFDSLKRRDAACALKASQYDDESSQRMVNIFQSIMRSVQQGHLDSWESMHLILIIRALDRVSRRSENIAEHVYFMVEGISLKHK